MASRSQTMVPHILVSHLLIRMCASRFWVSQVPVGSAACTPEVAAKVRKNAVKIERKRMPKYFSRILESKLARPLESGASRRSIRHNPVKVGPWGFSRAESVQRKKPENIGRS